MSAVKKIKPTKYKAVVKRVRRIKPEPVVFNINDIVIYTSTKTTHGLPPIFELSNKKGKVVAVRPGKHRTKDIQMLMVHFKNPDGSVQIQEVTEGEVTFHSARKSHFPNWF